MYILIEHSGSEEHNKAAEELKNFLEEQAGATVETSVADEKSNINVYNENLEKVLQFDELPSEPMLYFYLSSLLENEEENEIRDSLRDSKTYIISY